MSTRRRYDQISYMRKRAAEQQRRRRDATAGQYVVGRFICENHVYMLECVQLNHATWEVIEEPLTRDWRTFHRWITRQAAHQWINGTLRRDPTSLIVIDLARLVDGGKHRGIDRSQRAHRRRKKT